MSSSRFRVLWPVLGTLATAEAGARLLSPPEPDFSPAPVSPKAYFEQAELERGARFARSQRRLGLARQAVQLALLAALVGRDHRQPPDRQGPAADARAAVGLLTGLSTLSLPFSILSRRRAQAVGLDTQSWGAWMSDAAKATAIGGALSAGAAAAISGLMRRYPNGWWLPAAGGSLVAGGLLGALAPVLVDPLFNRFEPLADGETRADVLALAKAAGVGVGEVYSVDASRRTTGANAYVNGLGLTKRVVLFDTLLDRYSPNEVRIVVAHELSHVRHRDVLRGLAFSGLVAGPAGLSVQRLSRLLSADQHRPSGVAALALALALVSGPVGLMAGRLSRAIERRADAESLALSADPDGFISFHRAIALQNVADVDPPRWVGHLLASHPPTLERIGAAVAFRERAGSPAAS